VDFSMTPNPSSIMRTPACPKGSLGVVMRWRGGIDALGIRDHLKHRAS
jgi:hypothetical protein